LTLTIDFVKNRENKGCSPNVVAYNVVIHGLCRAGCIDEAIEVRKSMVEKVFGNREKRLKEAKLILS
jgi:pentatricopeptide repeat protein